MARKGESRTARRTVASYTPYIAERRKRSVNVAHRKTSTEVTARRKTSHEVAEEVITDPETIESIECGLADLKAGRVKPWSKVKRSV
jgi:hypothetical protein